MTLWIWRIPSIPTVPALVALLTTCALVPGARAQDSARTAFAAIYVAGKKVGQAHFTVHYGEDGSVDEFHASASLSVLGFQIFHHTAEVHEVWRTGELQSLRSRSDDGRIRETAEVTRNGQGYTATLNGKPAEVPGDALPASPWHIAITRERELFNPSDLNVMKVQVKESAEALALGDRRVDARRFDFSGDWTASIWYDKRGELVKLETVLGGRKLALILDPT